MKCKYYEKNEKCPYEGRCRFACYNNINKKDVNKEGKTNKTENRTIEVNSKSNDSFLEKKLEEMQQRIIRQLTVHLQSMVAPPPPPQPQYATQYYPQYIPAY